MNVEEGGFETLERELQGEEYCRERERGVEKSTREREGAQVSNVRRDCLS